MSVLQVYLHWANTLLSETKNQIQGIFGFQTGKPLCQVIDTLCQDAGLCDRVQSSSQAKDQHYVQAALDHMRRNGIKFTFTPQDVMEGDIKAMLDLLWTVILNYNIHTIERSAYKRTVGTGKKLLSEWCQRQLPGDFDARSTLSYNLCKNDNFVKILEQQVEVNTDSTDKLTRLSSLLQATQEKFGIIKEIVMPAEILDKSIDEHTMLIYIALLKRKVSNGLDDTFSSLSRTSSTSLLELEDAEKDSGSGSGLGRESKASTMDHVGEPTSSPTTNDSTSLTREGNVSTNDNDPAPPVTMITSNVPKDESKVATKDIPSSNYSKGSLLSRLWAGDRSTKLEAKLAGKQTTQTNQPEVFVEQKFKENILVHDMSSFPQKLDAESVHIGTRDGPKGCQEPRTAILGRPLHMSVDGSDITDDTSDWMSSSTGSIVSMSNEKQMKEDGDPSVRQDTESQLMDVISQRIMDHLPDMNESEDESTDKDTVITQTNSEHSYLSGEQMKGANLQDLQEDIEEEAQDFNDESPVTDERKISDVSKQRKDLKTRQGSINTSNDLHVENTGNRQNDSEGAYPNMQGMNPGFPMFFMPGQGPDMMKFMEVYKRMQEEELMRQESVKNINHDAGRVIQNGGLSNGVNFEAYHQESKFQTSKTNSTQDRQFVSGEVDDRRLPSSLSNENFESSDEVYSQKTIPSSREWQDSGHLREDIRGSSNQDDKNIVQIQVERSSANHLDAVRSQSPNSSSDEVHIPRPTVRENDLSVQFEMISKSKRQDRSKNRETESVDDSYRQAMLDDREPDYISHSGRVASPHRLSQEYISNTSRPTTHVRKDTNRRYITKTEPKLETMKYSSGFNKDRQMPRSQVRRSPVRTGNERKSRLDNFREFAQRQQEKLLPKEDRKASRERSAEKSKNISKQLDELDRELQEKLKMRLAEERLTYPHPLIDRDIDDKSMHDRDGGESSDEKKMVKLLSEEIDNLKSKVNDLERSQNELNLASSQRDLPIASVDDSSSWSPSRTYPLTSKTLDKENKMRDRGLGDSSMTEMDRNLSVDDLGLTKNDISFDETSLQHQYLNPPSSSQRRAISLQDISDRDGNLYSLPGKKVSSMRKLLDFGYSSPVRSVSQEIWGKDLSSMQDLDPDRQEKWKSLSASSYGINEEEILQLKQCLSSATMENEILQAKLNNFTKETSDKMKKTHEILDDSRKLLAKSQGENAELRSKLTREKVRSEALEEQMKDIRTELFKSKAEQFEMEAEMQLSIDMMRDVVPPNLPGIHVMQHENEELQGRVEVLQTEKLRLNQELDACRHQRDTAQNTVADLKNCLQDARNERKLLMEELNSVHITRKTEIFPDNISHCKNRSELAEDDLNHSIRSASGRLEKADLDDLFDEIQAKRSRPTSQHQRSSTRHADDQVIFPRKLSNEQLQLGDLEKKFTYSHKTIYPHRKNNSYLQSRLGKDFDGRLSPLDTLRNGDIGSSKNFSDDDLSEESVQRISENADIENGYSISQYNCPCNMDSEEFGNSNFDRNNAERCRSPGRPTRQSPNRPTHDYSPLRPSESPSTFLQNSSSSINVRGGTRAIRDSSPVGRSCSPNRFLRNAISMERSVSPNLEKRDASPIGRSRNPNRFLQNSIPVDRASSPNRFLQNNIHLGNSSPSRAVLDKTPLGRSKSPNRFLQSPTPLVRSGSPNRFLHNSISDRRSRSPNGNSSSPDYRSVSPNRFTQNGISVSRSRSPNRTIQNTQAWSPKRSPIEHSCSQSDVGYLNGYTSLLRTFDDEDDDDIMDSIIESPTNMLPSLRRSRSEENLLDLDDEFDDVPLRRPAMEEKPLKSYGSVLDVRLWDDEIDDCSDLLGDRWKPEKFSLFNKRNIHVSPDHLSPKARGILNGKNGFKKFNLNRSLSPQRPNSLIKHPSHSPLIKLSPLPKRSPFLKKSPVTHGRTMKASNTGVVRNLGHDFEDDDVLNDDIMKPPTNRPKSWAEFKASLRK